MITSHKKTFIKVFSAAAMAFVLLYIITSQQTKDALATKIDEQEIALLETATIIDRDGIASDLIELVPDCSLADREAFDAFLSRLSALGSTELQSVQGLFESCGNYYALRRALMVERLETQLAMYQNYHDIAGAAFFASTNTPAVTLWEELVQLEKERSELTNELVTVQGSIINALVDGEPANGEVISTYINAADKIKQSLLSRGTAVDDLRSRLSVL